MLRNQAPNIRKTDYRVVTLVIVVSLIVLINLINAIPLVF